MQSIFLAFYLLAFYLFSFSISLASSGSFTVKNDHIHSFFFFAVLVANYKFAGFAPKQKYTASPFPRKWSVLQNPDRERTNQSAGICPRLALPYNKKEYKDLYGKTRPETRQDNFTKKLSIKKPNFIAIVGRFLPVCFFFPDSTRIKPLSVHRLSTVIVNTKAEHSILTSPPSSVTYSWLKCSQRIIQGQRFFFHFNPLAAQMKPCQRCQAAVSVPNESIKRWKSLFKNQHHTATVEFPLGCLVKRLAGVLDRNLPSTLSLFHPGSP